MGNVFFFLLFGFLFFWIIRSFVGFITFRLVHFCCAMRRKKVVLKKWFHFKLSSTLPSKIFKVFPFIFICTMKIVTESFSSFVKWWKISLKLYAVELFYFAVSSMGKLLTLTEQGKLRKVAGNFSFFFFTLKLCMQMFWWCSVDNLAVMYSDILHYDFYVVKPLWKIFLHRLQIHDFLSTFSNFPFLLRKLYSMKIA